MNDPIDNTAFGAGGIDQPGTTWIYRYDRGGNILAKEIYDYTTGTVGAVIRTISFTYGDTNWKDKLTVFDNATYTYDSIGNLTQDAWWTYTWEAGRQLKKLSHGSGDDLAEIEFTYNHAGIRTKKVKKLGGVLQTTTEYILNGDKVVELIYTDHVNNTVDILHFYYDAQGKPAMVKHGSNMYAYVYNLQGDVLGLLDNTNALVADYRYDAWGSQGPEINDDVGHLNPFRYRGYIYDVETGLYYLKSRYYNSMICRFVNADSVLNCDEISTNVYNYCNNDPIIKADYNGKAYLIVLNIWEDNDDDDKNGHYSFSIFYENGAGCGPQIPGAEPIDGAELVVSYGGHKGGSISFPKSGDSADYRYIIGEVDDDGYTEIYFRLWYYHMKKRRADDTIVSYSVERSSPFYKYDIDKVRYCGSFVGFILSDVSFIKKNESTDELLSMLQLRPMYVNRQKFNKVYPNETYIIDYLEYKGFERFLP